VGLLRKSRARLQTLRRILNIGLPAGGEFFMMFVIIVFIYWAIRNFGPAAQAGTGIGFRVVQAVFLPVLAIAFGASPLAGQNFGAGKTARVKETFRTAAVLSSVFMLAVTLLCQWRPEVLIEPFTRDREVVAVGALYLRIVSWNFVANGLIFTCSSLFQALGNTWPSLLSSGLRLLTFVLPAVWMSTLPHFELKQLWYLSVCSTALQAATSLLLLRSEFRRKLGSLRESPAGVQAAS
jgi:Na+-driven multidrug efflux pump